MVVANSKTLKKNVRMVSEIYNTLKKEIKQEFNDTSVGDEGGFSPNLENNETALNLITKAIKKLKYTKETYLANDVAANEIYNKKTKKYEIEKNKKISSKSLEKYYLNLIEKFNLKSIEDPFNEDDFEAFINLTKKVKDKNILIVGDDLLTTNPIRIKKAIKEKQCNSLLLKINQIGTFTESLKSYNLAKESNWEVIVSHRSGDCEDSFIADLCVGLESSIKLGAPCRSERVCKYNRLLEIFSKFE